jgi:hypothetical protein
VMPLGDRADGSPDGQTWDGVALALFVDIEALRAGRAAGAAAATHEGSQPVPGDPPAGPAKDVLRPD